MLILKITPKNNVTNPPKSPTKGNNKGHKNETNMASPGLIANSSKKVLSPKKFIPILGKKVYPIPKII